MTINSSGPITRQRRREGLVIFWPVKTRAPTDVLPSGLTTVHNANCQTPNMSNRPWHSYTCIDLYIVQTFSGRNVKFCILSTNPTHFATFERSKKPNAQMNDTASREIVAQFHRQSISRDRGMQTSETTLLNDYEKAYYRENRDPMGTPFATQHHKTYTGPYRSLWE